MKCERNVERVYRQAMPALSAIADSHNLVVVGRHPMDAVRRRLSAVVATAVLERSHTHVAVVPEAAPQ